MPKKYPYQHARRICARNICADCKGGLNIECTLDAEGHLNTQQVTIMCVKCGSRTPRFLSKWWRENAARAAARAAQ